MTLRVAIAALAVVVTAACSGSPASVAPTFNREVAPLLHAHCSNCHRPQGSGPFDLLTYNDARKRARQIADVTASGYMPPWLPEPGHGEFAGARRLTSDAIAVFADWVAGGMPAGEEADLAPAPEWPDGWQLGTPDLVIEMSQAYTLAAEGIDVYRNFVIPPSVSAGRWVRAVEFRPGNPKVVHHARLFVDETGAARRSDAAETLPGFSGMELAGAQTPGGTLIGWTPGRVPHPGRPGMAWRLEPSTDIVLQLHLLPSGRPEPIRASLGLYFSDEPPTQHPYAFVLGSRDIDIAAGQTDFRVEDSYVLPVDVDVLAIYPHAHYLGKTMQVDATLPDGSSVSLLRIDDWDFNWQDEYHYESPITLPRGASLAMHYSFDNSAENPRNPSFPPQRVTYGARSSDEMAELMLQVLTRDEVQRDALARNYATKTMRDAIAYRQRRLEAHPEDVVSLAALGATYLSLDQIDAALPPLREAVRLAPSDAALRNNLGYALKRLGRDSEAARHFHAAIELNPDDAEAHFNLAGVLRATGRTAEAIPHYARAVELRPESQAAREALERARSESE
jgi:hypothetical protein